MSTNDFPDDPGPQAAWRFASTRWSIVAAAGRKESPEARAALAVLCQAYWYPLYAYARRRLSRAQDAQDLTQEFFARLLEKDYLQAADLGTSRPTIQQAEAAIFRTKSLAASRLCASASIPGQRADQHQRGLPMHHRCLKVRMKTSPLEIASEEFVSSPLPSSLTVSSSYLGLAARTTVSPLRIRT